jgi:hypothetical protein
MAPDYCNVRSRPCPLLLVAWLVNLPPDSCVRAMGQLLGNPLHQTLTQLQVYWDALSTLNL